MENNSIQLINKDINNSVFNNSTQLNVLHKWKLGSLNIRSGKEKLEGARIYGITKEISRENLEICCLQEVKYRNTGKKIIELDTGVKYNFLWCGQKKRRAAGVGLLIKSERGITINPPDFNDPRIMGINIVVHGFKIRLVTAYSPTNVSDSESAKDDFYRKLKKACENRPKNYKLIIAGDFNAETSFVYGKTEFNGSNIMYDELCNDNGLRLKSLSRQYKLCMPQTFFEHPMEERYTWYSSDKKTKKILDYVLVPKFVNQYITDCLVKPQLDFQSDHRILITTLETPKDKKTRWKPRPPGRRILDIKKLTDAHYQSEYRLKVSEEILKRKSDGLTIDEVSDNLVKSLSNAAAETLPNLNKKKISQLWKDDSALNKLLDDRAKTTKDSIQYVKISRMIKSRIRKLRNEKLRLEADELNSFATKREIEALYKSFKSEGSTFREMKRKNDCDPQKMKEYFAKHFGLPENSEEPIELMDAPDFIKKLNEIPADFDTLAPEKEEILNTLKRLKNGKSANDLPAIYLKSALQSEELINEILSLFKTIWLTKQIPSKWGHSKLVTIWKGAAKGKADDPAAYRGIQIGSTFCKILVIMILERTRKWYEKQLLDEQQGFRSCRGTNEGIYILKRIQQISQQTKRPVSALFIDLTAAFDHVRRKWLFKSIKQRFPNQESNTLIDLLESLYSYTTTSLNDSNLDIFEILVGVRQGGPESPTLFNLFIDYVMRIFTQECERKNIKFIKPKYTIPKSASTSENNYLGSYGSKIITWVGYADDIVLVFEDNHNMQEGLIMLNKTFKRFGLKINVSKTKSMIFNFDGIEAEYPESVCNLDGGRIDNVKKFIYLGASIWYNDPLTGDGELNQRIESAECKYYEHAKKFLNYRINLATRVKILNALVRSRLTYGCQTWTLNTVQMNKLNSFYCGLLRRMIRGGFKRQENRMAFVHSNDAILQICKTEKMQTFIARQQKSFLANVIRREDDALIKQLTFNSDQIRKRGRSSTLRKTVLQQEKLEPNTFYREAILRKF